MFKTGGCHKPPVFLYSCFMKTQLIQDAIAVLEGNVQEGGFTIPSKGLYPFQWKWDSGFIALGFGHYDMDKALREMSTLLDSQWGNGFIPHIVFHTKTDTYFPGEDFHQSELHPQASKKYRSTGMTQPPVLGFVLERLYQMSKDKGQVLEFIDAHIDKIYDNHAYFYNNRDRDGDGLIYIYHNWESGTDNSPIWDAVWETMDPPHYEFERKDTTHVDASQRPTKREYDHYLHIIEMAKAVNYNDQSIAEQSPFLVQDPLFNAMLVRSNEALISLYELMGRSLDKRQQLEQWSQKTTESMNKKLFDEDLGAYIHYDLRNDKPIAALTSSSFTPLYAGVPSTERAARMAQLLTDRFGGKDRYLCASFDPEDERFNPKKYWRGPVWINVNWLLYHGLKRYGMNDLSNQVKADSLHLIEQFGFYEYFDPRKINGEETNAYGGGNFSWSAALIIDLLSE